MSPHPLQELEKTFATMVLRELSRIALDYPDEAKSLIRAFKARLDAQDQAISEWSAPIGGLSNDAGTGSMTADCGEMVPNGLGGLPTGDHDPGLAQAGGRNQQSQIRMLATLEYLSRSSRARSRKELVNYLDAKGYGASDAAIGSQLHRLKNDGTISQPLNGAFELTPSGFDYLKKMRERVGHLYDDI